MQPLFPQPEPSSARWIWGPNDPAQRNLMRLFRCRFTASDPSACWLRIAADTRYRAWLNGRWLGRGAAQSMPWLMYEDSWDLDGLLRPGDNLLAIAVYHLGTMPGTRPGLRAEVVDASGARLAASGGPGWSTCADPSWICDSEDWHMNHRGRFQEQIDLRREAAGWTDGPDPGWVPAQIIPGRLPWTLVVPADVARPAETPLPAPTCAAIEECQALVRNRRDLSIDLSQAGRPPQRILAEGLDNLGSGGARIACAYPRDRDDTAGIHDPCVLLDAGRVVNAFVELEVEAPESAEIELGFAERLVDGRFNNALECWFASRWICRQGRQTLRMADWRAFRWLRLRLKRCPVPLTIHAIRLVGVGYPLAEPAACAIGDEALERIRAISLASIRLCCVDGIYDTPFREGAQWLGDVALVSVPALHRVYGDCALSGKYLRQSHAGRTSAGFLPNLSNVPTDDPAAANQIPDFSLWWAWALREQWRWSGDRRWLDLCWPGVLGLLAAQANLLGADGLVHDVPGWLFIDWAPVERGRTCAAYNAILAIALDAIAAMAVERGDTVAVATCAEMRAGLQRGFAAAFWDESAGCVLDGPGSASVSEQANAAAILAGLLTPAQVARVVETVFAAPRRAVVEAEPFFMAVVLPALRKAGRTDLALDLVRRRWGRMLAQGVTSVLEEWGENGSWRNGRFLGFQRTHSHAWSACPATFLIEALAGVEILTPGGGRVRVQHWPAPFPYRIGCRLPQGELVVAWDGRAAAITAPPGVTVTRE